MVAAIKTVRYKRWVGGVNNVTDLTDLTPSDPRLPRFLADAVNVDLDDAGKPTRRRGASLLAGGAWHSLWSEDGLDDGYAVGSGWLTRVRYEAGALDLLQLMPLAGARASYAYIAGDVFYSDGQTTGRLAGGETPRNWGVEDAGAPLVVATANGGMRVGKYRVALTWCAANGEQSGTQNSVDVELTAPGGLLLSAAPPLETATTHGRLWVSEPGGEELYYAADVPRGFVNLTLGAAGRGRVLDTLHMSRFPPCDGLRAYRGRIYGYIGNTLLWTQALRYGLYAPHRDTLSFESDISFIEPVDDGLYVGTAKAVYWLPGDDPKSFKLEMAVDTGAVPFASVRLAGSAIGDSLQGAVAAWWNNRGVVMTGAAGGQAVQLTKDTLALPKYGSGALLRREQDGARHVVSVMREPGPANALAARDFATVEVRRNGAVVPVPRSYRHNAAALVAVGDAAAYTVS